MQLGKSTKVASAVTSQGFSIKQTCWIMYASGEVGLWFGSAYPSLFYFLIKSVSRDGDPGSDDVCPASGASRRRG